MNEVFNSSNPPPRPPNKDDNTSWRSCLRWLVCVMNDDDPSLLLVTTALADLMEGRMQPWQEGLCQIVLTAICTDYHNGVLDCQNDVYQGELGDNVVLFKRTENR